MWPFKNVDWGKKKLPEAMTMTKPQIEEVEIATLTEEELTKFQAYNDTLQGLEKSLEAIAKLQGQTHRKRNSLIEQLREKYNVEEYDTASIDFETGILTGTRPVSIDAADLKVDGE